MKQRIIALLLVLSIAISLSITVQAYGEDGHNELIEEILFGDANYSDKLTGEKLESLQSLEYATMICLDQFQGKYEDELKFLKKQKIHGLPKDINSINFKGNQYHRMYTHKGWDFSYTPTTTSKEANWSARKTLLLQTVNHVFDFQDRAGEWTVFFFFKKDYGYSKQCDSFAAFMYYLHILGEYEEAAADPDKHYSTTNGPVIPLANAHPSDSNADLFWELEKHLPVIFETQKKEGSSDYAGMMNDIKILAEKARRLAAGQGGITKDNFSEYCQYALELIEILKERIPGLLEKEEFFSTKLYANK